MPEKSIKFKVFIYVKFQSKLLKSEIMTNIFFIAQAVSNRPETTGDNIFKGARYSVLSRASISLSALIGLVSNV